MAESDTSNEPGKRPERLHDRFFKEAFRHAKFVISLFRVGAPDKLFNIIDWSTLSPQPTRIAIPGMPERFADLVFSAELKGSGKPVHVILLLEHKSYRDVRLLAQMAWNLFLMYLQSDFESLIIPIVVHQVDPRKKSRKPTTVEFIDLFENLPDEHRAILTEYSVNFKCVMVDVNEIDRLGLARDTDIDSMIHMMSKVREGDLFVMQEVYDRLNSVAPEDRDWMYNLMYGYFSDYNWRFTKDDLSKIARTPEELKMIQSAVELFRQEGREEARNEFQEERQRLQSAAELSRQEGWEQAQEKLATNLLRDGMNLEKIVQLTDLSPDAVQKLQRKTDKT